MQAVFKIDSQSGRTWIYRELLSRDHLTEGWSELVDIPSVQPISQPGMANGISSFCADLRVFLEWASANSAGWTNLDANGHVLAYTAAQIANRREQAQKLLSAVEEFNSTGVRQ